MTRILHLSDLHYGRVDPELEAPLLAQIAELAPDLVVISGDLTQRARRRQFASARAFIDKITQPVLVVPGNHDTPLDNVFLRLFKPFSRYRKAINQVLDPTFEAPGLRVLGINSVNPLAWQSGQIPRRALRRMRRAFTPGAQALQVAVMHHPLEQRPGARKTPMKGADRALQALSETGADLLLSGHLHTAEHGPLRAEPGLLLVQAGTGLSTRLRGEENTFNMIDAKDDAVTITTWQALKPERAAPAFQAQSSTLYQRQIGGDWKPAPQGTGQPTNV